MKYTKAEIKELQKIIKTRGYYDPSDCRKVIIEFEGLCGLNATIFDILDMALQTLSIKAENQALEMIA